MNEITDFLADTRRSVGLCSLVYPSATQLKFGKFSLQHIYLSVIYSFWYFARSTAMKLYKTSTPIYQFARMLLTNDISRDFSFRWVWEGYPLLHNALGPLLRTWIKLWNGITDTFANFNDATADVPEWLRSFTPHCTIEFVSIMRLKLIYLSKRGPLQQRTLAVA